MARAALNKTALLQEKRAVAAYKAVLPALELKRRSLIAARAAEARALAALVETRAGLSAKVEATLPMLSDLGVPVEPLLAIAAVRVGEEIAFGVALPRLDGVDFHEAAIGAFVFPHWVEPALALAREAARGRIAEAIGRRRLSLLERAVAKATQRVNLLEKVLIPQAQARIRAIDIRLSDLERAGVVTAKLAKARAP